MENEAPNYAKWIPEAGGYVANGQVVSKSPVYEEDGSGKMKLNVDASAFQPQQQPSTSSSKYANDPITNYMVGDRGEMISLNQQGSKEDANSLMTGSGSLGSLNNNTATTGGVLTSPATTSPNTNLKPSQISGLSTDDLMAQYAQFQAENNYQGMINTLTQMSAADGIDRSAMINNLQRARGEKIMSQDDKYLQAINQARQYAEQTGDYTQYNQLVAEQQAYRDMVGYQDAMQRQYNMEMEDQKLDYESTWTQATNDMTNAIIQMTSSLLNFQYDPSADENLLRAQAHTELMMRNNAAATGMYYSSTTQYAIAQAIGELVPVYQKMAKEEAMENLKLLQSTANYLMNVEEHQFDMWKAQIEMQWAANNEKRKEWQQAIDSSNARGYVSNEEALILGVPAGSMSYEERQRMEAKQDQIESDARKLEQSMILEQFKDQLDLESYAQKQAIQAKYEVSTYAQKQAIQAQYDLNTYARKRQIDAAYGNGSGGGNKGGKGTTTTPDGETIELPEGYQDTLKYLQGLKSYNATDRYNAVKDLLADKVDLYIMEQKNNFGEDYGKTKDAVTAATNKIIEYANLLNDAGIDGAESYAEYMFDNLFEQIDAATKFDYSFTDFSDNWDELKQKAKNDIIDQAKNSSKFLGEQVVPNLSTTRSNKTLYIKTNPDGSIEDVTEQETNKLKNAAKKDVENRMNNKTGSNLKK